MSDKQLTSKQMTALVRLATAIPEEWEWIRFDSAGECVARMSGDRWRAAMERCYGPLDK